jgi:pimeloyl-ACP methyl ester carboxylesterase
MSEHAAASVIKPAPQMVSAPRWWRGVSCCATFLVAPFGAIVPRRFTQRMAPEHLDQGLVLILPGIEGRSFLNLAIFQGLLDGGVPYAVDVADWTTGYRILTLYHLRAWKRNQRIARELAERILAYQAEYPGRPVWIVGHSGGGGMALLTAAALPKGQSVTGLVLLAPAVSPRFDLTPALEHVERGIWSFYSYWDCLFIGLGTMVFGCLDGPHGPAAGMVGFRHNAPDTAAALEQLAHSWQMVRQFHIGGHFGCAQRVFIAETVAPLLLESRL